MKGVVPEEEVGGADKTEIPTVVGGTEDRTGKTGKGVGGTEVEGNGTAVTVVISEVDMGRTYRAEA